MLLGRKYRRRERILKARIHRGNGFATQINSVYTFASFPFNTFFVALKRESIYAAYISMWALEVIYSNAAMEQKGKPETKKVNPFSARPSDSHKWNYRLTGRPRMTSCHVAPQAAVLATCPDDNWIYGAFRGRLVHCLREAVLTTVFLFKIRGTVILILEVILLLQ